MILFAHDPGTTNYGYSIVEGRKVSDSAVQFRILENGLAPVTIKNLKVHKERRREMREYREWVRGKIEQYDCKALLGERYMTRGISGPTIESVNMMLGVLQCFELKDKFIPAATWKNAVTRSGIELKAEYKFARVTPHQLDATLMGVYGLYQGWGIKDFGNNLTQDLFNRIVAACENTSTHKLANRKHKKE